MLDLVLGLYAMVLRTKDTTTPRLHAMIVKNHDRIFPARYFGSGPLSMPAIMKKLVEEDAEMQELAERTSKVLGAQDHQARMDRTRRAGTQLLKLKKPGAVAPLDSNGSAGSQLDSDGTLRSAPSSRKKRWNLRTVGTAAVVTEELSEVGPR